MQRKSIITAIMAFLFMLLGLCCYIFFNHRSYLSVILPAIQLPNNQNWTVSFIKMVLTCYAADFCWSFAFPLALQSVLQLAARKQWWLLCCVVLGYIYEFLQGGGILRGTFDWGDIVTYTIGTFGSLWIIKMVWRKQK